MDSVHWQITLSDPDAAKREEGRRARDCHSRFSRLRRDLGLAGSGGVRFGLEEDAWSRSVEEIRKTLPLAADLGIHILIENVWNRFLYEHDGPNNQSAEKFAAYLDAIDSPWVGAYFDIGNHQKYGLPAAWIRTLGSRLVKCDVKDWGVQGAGLVLVTAMLIGRRSTKPCRISVSPVGFQRKLAVGTRRICARG